MIGSRRTANGNVLDVSHTTARHELRRRAPWMMLGLIAGAFMIIVGRNFETAFSERLELVFFLPMIVYLSDSIGTETMALFVRELALRRVNLKKLFWREAFVGISIGLLTGIPMGIFSALWFDDVDLGKTIALAMTLNGLIAVLIGMLTPVLFAKFKKDPALGTDEITTALSDNISMLIYLLVAGFILF